jgi:hypothetical protein
VDEEDDDVEVDEEELVAPKENTGAELPPFGEFSVFPSFSGTSDSLVSTTLLVEPKAKEIFLSGFASFAGDLGVSGSRDMPRAFADIFAGTAVVSLSFSASPLSNAVPNLKPLETDSLSAASAGLSFFASAG